MAKRILSFGAVCLGLIWAGWSLASPDSIIPGAGQTAGHPDYRNPKSPVERRVAVPLGRPQGWKASLVLQGPTGPRLNFIQALVDLLDQFAGVERLEQNLLEFAPHEILGQSHSASSDDPDGDGPRERCELISLCFRIIT